jgi:eukaryotic-like serine/threonine-protein kinase
LVPKQRDRESARIIGRYVLYDEIASGGMATVHYGRLLGPVGFSRTVAIKRLRPQFARDQEFVAMFVDEARLAARIRHPNVVPTLDVVATDGELYLVMDYVQGESLSRLLRASRAKGSIPTDVASAIFCGALHGLHAAHEATDEHGKPLGLVHRDVSPQNILVGVEGIARVLDFGVAMAAGRAQATGHGRIKGKLSYLAPEQVHGIATRQTDVFATAVALWEVLTGKRLFQGDTPRQILSQILTTEIAPPTSHAPHLSPWVDAIVMRGLERDPTKRYATARDMAIDLEACLGLASPTQVGAWVDSVAHDALVGRAAIVAEIESASSQFRDVTLSAHLSGPPSVPAPESGISVNHRSGVLRCESSDAHSLLPPPPSVDSVPGPASGSRRWGRRAIALGCALSLGALAAIALSQGPRRFASAHPSSASSSTVTVLSAASAAPSLSGAAPSPPSTVGPVIGGPDSVVSIAATAAAVASASVAPTRPPVRAVVDRQATGKAKAPVAAAPVAAAPLSADPDCEPPYSLDARGHKIWKDACFRKRDR